MPNENVQIQFDIWIDKGLRRPLGAGTIAENVTNLGNSQLTHFIYFLHIQTSYFLNKKNTDKKVKISLFNYAKNVCLEKEPVTVRIAGDAYLGYDLAQIGELHQPLLYRYIYIYILKC